MMNERIKEILSKINSPVGYIGNWGRVQWAGNVYPQLGDDLYARVDLEKFAELIVRECAQICKTVGGDQVSNASEDYQEGREMGAEVCHNMIKKYFGVE